MDSYILNTGHRCFFVIKNEELQGLITLHNIKITRDVKTGQLTMEATAKTYRYLEQEELEAELAKAKKKAKGR